jgi:hypothetical protein
VIPSFRPMPLEHRRDPFDDPEWIFELKYDGFRVLAFVAGGTKLVSRRGLGYRQFGDFASEIALELNADDAVLDGETVKLDESGRPIFIDLMRRRGPFAFVAFDVLAVNGRDVRKMALVERGSSGARSAPLARDILRRLCPPAWSGSLHRSMSPGSRGGSWRSGRPASTTWPRCRVGSRSRIRSTARRHELFEHR